MAQPTAPQRPRPEITVTSFAPRERTRYHGEASETFNTLSALFARLHVGPPTEPRNLAHWYAHGLTALALQQEGAVPSEAALHIALHLDWDAWEHQADDTRRQLEMLGMEPVEMVTANGNPSRLTVADKLNGGKLIHLDVFYAGYEGAHMVQFYADGYLAIPGWLVADAMPASFAGYRVPLPDRIERYLAAYFGPSRARRGLPPAFDIHQSPAWRSYEGAV